MELEQGKAYLSKELAEIGNTSVLTIRIHSHKLFPDVLLKSNKKTYYTYEQAKAILENIRSLKYPTIKQDMGSYLVIGVYEYDVLIDSEDWERIKDKHWKIKKSNLKKGLCYFITAFGTQKKYNTYKQEYMHRFIMNFPNSQVDHISGNTLDNRKSNLRVCTVSENGCNQKKRKDNTSGYKGVSWDKRSGRWYAMITKNKKQHNLGYYTTAEEAYAAYCKAAKELHGEFARLA